jgi:Ca-activated chloride channel family protein
MNADRQSATRLLRTRSAAMLAALVLFVFGAASLAGRLVQIQPALAAPQAAAINVTVPVRVTDRLGRYVSGLEKTHFRIREDGVEQQISEFLSSPWGQSDPVSMVLLSNASGAIPREAVEALTKAGHPADEFVTLRLEPGTLLESVRMAIDQTQSARNARRAIVIVSENGGDAPAYNESETKAIAAAAGVPIYSLSAFPNASTAAVLDDLALNTGGRHFKISDAAELRKSEDMAKMIAVGLRNFYVLTFQSTNTVRDGRYRSIDVELLPPRGISSLHSDYRAGYYAPRP